MDKILIVGPSWIGDMVMAQSLFISIKNNNPEVIIDVVAPEWSIPLLERIPEINKAFSLPVRHKQLSLITRYKMAKALRSEGYQKAIIIPRSFKSALVPFFARIPVRTGYRGEMRYGLLNDIRLLDKTILRQTVQRYVNLGKDNSELQSPETPFPKLVVHDNNKSELIEKFQLSLDKPIVGLMPGAEYGPAKQWPYYAELAEQLTIKGYQVWIFGSQKDNVLGENIAGDNEDIFNLSGKTQLVDAIDLISGCKKIITNDSGLMHIAAAVGVPLIAIYGSSTPDYTPPLTNKADVLYNGLECSPCFKRVCPLGHTKCLKDVSVEEVLGKMDI
mgnify:CR=1 FL=1